MNENEGVKMNEWKWGDHQVVFWWKISEKKN